MSIHYRKDIDGLRAVAVIPVVLFHAGIPFFSGGYVGVDIFFVISGYLITTILMKQLNQGSFSIATFYERRIKRIFPALFSILIACSIVANWIMLPGEFDQFKKSLVATLFFYSNYFFMFDVGYFAEHAETKPLLHMWSLAVEEQFYVLFPLYLYLGFKYFKRHLFKVAVILLIVSLVYSELLVSELPSDAFYSTPARAWELLVGSLLAICPQRLLIHKKVLANGVSLIGLSLIIYAIVFFSKTTPFPGLMAAVPVLGSVMILASAHTQGNFVGVLLSSPVFRFFGLISYSLYLWHWPVLTFARLYSLGSHSYDLIPFLLVLMVVLAYLSWRFIETPFRKNDLFTYSSKWKLNKLSVILLLSFVAITTLSFSDYRKKIPREYRAHLEKRVDSKPLQLTDCDQYKASKRNLVLCKLGDLDAEKISFVVLGDSHAFALLPGLQESARRHGKKGYYVGSGGCIALFGVSRVKQGFEHCLTRMVAMSEFLAEHPEIKQVILASRWGTYTTGKRYKNTLGDPFYIRDELTETLSFEENKKVFERGFDRTIAWLRAQDRETIVITQVPESEYGSLDMVRANMLGKSIDFRPVLAEYMERQKIAFDVFNYYQKKGDIELIKMHEYMCDQDTCEVIEAGKSIYIDNNHISRTYALKLAPVYDGLFND